MFYLLFIIFKLQTLFGYKNVFIITLWIVAEDQWYVV